MPLGKVSPSAGYLDYNTIIVTTNRKSLNPITPRGGRICPPTTYFLVKHLKHIERDCNFLTFPKYGFQTDLKKKMLTFYQKMT